MSKGMWWALAVVAGLIIIAGGAWYWVSKSGAYPESGSGTVQQSEPSPATATLPSGTQTSDAALEADLNAMDSQIGAFSSDNANINAGLSDQQVQQSSL